MPKAYIIAQSAISYRRYITRSAGNGYHCKKHAEACFLHVCYMHFRFSPLTLSLYNLPFRPQSYGLRSERQGFSHGLKKCPPDTFLPGLRPGRPFESHRLHMQKAPARLLSNFIFRNDYTAEKAECEVKYPADVK